MLYDVVFEIKPSSELVPALKVVKESVNEDDAENLVTVVLID